MPNQNKNELNALAHKASFSDNAAHEGVDATAVHAGLDSAAERMRCTVCAIRDVRAGKLHRVTTRAKLRWED